jgi:AcrR family transcriptional regulator
MKAGSRDARRQEIMDVAVEVLSERGYRDTTMLEVARRAFASKETLYAWFGDKGGLFEAVIRRNAKAVQTVLARHLEGDARPEEVLPDFGRALLELLLGDSAVAINRAAISEARSDPRLAQILSSAGREATLPGFIRFLELCQERGALRMDSPAQAAEDFLGLLLGDSQTRRLLGLLPAPKKPQVEARAARATRKFLRLYAP